jgi:Flp pilus assembly protein TadG
VTARTGPFLSPLRRFCDDAAGIAAVEMAFIAPIALALLSLIVAGGQSLTTYHKVVLAAHSVTDLVARTPYSPDPNTQQAELLAKTSLDATLALSQMVMYPSSTTNLTVLMTEVFVNSAKNQGTVIWSRPFPAGGSTLAVGSVISLDPNLVAAGASCMLIGTVNYTFQPLQGILFLPTLNLTSTETLTIRNATQITLN